jgi:preprotein translocase SecE subunit
MARNRKRAKERRARRPQPVGSRQSAARTGDGAAQRAPERPDSIDSDRAPRPDSIDSLEEEVVPGPTAAHPDELAPDPLGHAAPDVELADAQIALGGNSLEPIDAAEAQREEELLEEELEDQEQQRAEEALPAAAPEHAGLIERLVGFLQGSWRELQRVQWPDRRQVAQATGVVLGFVIVAGVFLGVADLLSQKLVTFIIK